MKRKLNLVGSGTMTISLPNKWVKDHNLKKGDEVDLEHLENGALKIKTGNTINTKFVKTIDIGNKKYVAKRLVGAMYKAGYDSVEFIYSTADELKLIQEVINQSCIGFDIVELTKNRVIVESVATIETENFDKILRRLFFVLNDVSNELKNSVETNDYANLEITALKDWQINKYSDFCRRTLNKAPLNHHKPCALYFILEQLEKIGDVYRDMCRVIYMNKLKLSKGMIELIVEINKYLSFFEELFYKYDTSKLDKFIDYKTKFLEHLKMQEKNLKNSELQIFVLLDRLANCLFDLNGALIIYKE